MRTPAVTPTFAALLVMLSACGGESSSQGPREPTYTDPGSKVEVEPSAADRAAYRALKKQVDSALGIGRDDFDETYAVTYAPLGYDPLRALNLDKVQSSSFELDTEQLDALAQHGVVIAKERSFPHFSAGLGTIYSEDLPLYVSADAILDALHQSYDELLKQLERDALLPALESLVDGLRTRLAAGQGKLGDAHADLDLYFTVAKALLSGAEANVVAGGDQALASAIVAKAQAAAGSSAMELFGVERQEDFSQFKPRGHYEGDERLERYFRAMMWLGRIDFRLLETQPDGSQLFRRRQVDAMLALYDLFDADSLALFTKIDHAIGEFVGESDYMVLGQVGALLEELGVARVADTKALSDQRLAEAIVRGGFGAQRIASHLITNLAGETLPLNRSFALLGQRYVLDSHVFANVTWARTKQMRMMPNPLDVAFAALGNDQAANLLSSELDQYDYQGNLHAMRLIADDHGVDYWEANLYTSWLSALRGLSPSALPEAAPSLMHTESWGRRMLNAQLGSWAELRHDTILYAKQSYTDGAACEFPDAYVDPYPAFWAALTRYAKRGLALADGLEGTASAPFVDRMREHFGTMRSTMQTLGAMAEQELTGVPFSAEQLAFINDAVRIDEGSIGCGTPPTYLGWYPRLLFVQSGEFDPTIADVHTQPTDEAGNEVGRVLHVGTGSPRATVLTVDTCEGPRAYVGLVFAYHEVVTEEYQRLTDSEWAADYLKRTPADVPWLSEITK